LTSIHFLRDISYLAHLIAIMPIQIVFITNCLALHILSDTMALYFPSLDRYPNLRICLTPSQDDHHPRFLSLLVLHYFLMSSYLYLIQKYINFDNTYSNNRFSNNIWLSIRYSLWYYGLPKVKREESIALLLCSLLLTFVLCLAIEAVTAKQEL